MRGLRRSVAWMLAGSLVAVAHVAGEEPVAETPWLRNWFPALRQEMESLPPFFRDTKLSLHLRTFYLNRTSTTPGPSSSARIDYVDPLRGGRERGQAGDEHTPVQ